MTDYLIKSILCLLVLWGFYKIALEQQTAHIFKRFYLLSSLIIAIALPLITITYSVAAAPQPIQEFNYVVQQNSIVAAPVDGTIDWLALSLWAIYLLGMIVFGFRFLLNIDEILSKIRQNVHVSTENAIYILIDQKIVPHTFLSYVFLPRKEYDSNRIPQEILRHEQTHVTQKHTLDILLIEVLQVVFWFNPLLHFLKKSIALNHEFLADQQVMNRQQNPENYINLLLRHAQGTHHAPMTSALNYSFTCPPYRRAKKRILMISQTFSAKKLAIRLAFLIPVLALCIYFFNQDLVAKPMVQEQSEISFKNQFKGKWRNTHQNIIFDIQDQNGGLVWDIIKNGASPVRYYPKPTKDGLYFTQGTNDVYYSIKNGLMEDSNGNTFEKFENAPRKLTIYIFDEKISVNAKPATLKTFAQIIDEITEDWTKEEMMNYTIQLRSNNGVNQFMGKLTSEFHKTKLYKTNPSKELIPPPPPPAPLAPSGYNSNNYAIAEITLEGNKDIYVKGKMTKLSNLKEIIRENLPNWIAEEQKPRALTIIQGAETSENRVQEVFKAMQGFQINSLNVIKENTTETSNSKNQHQKIEKYIDFKINKGKITIDDQEVDFEQVTATLNNLTKNWSKVDFEMYGIGLMQYPGTTESFKNKVEEELKKSEFYKKTGRTFLSPPPPPAPPVPAAPVMKAAPPAVPQAPPAPPSPATMIKHMTAAGATFYYNGDKISAKKAQELFKTKKNLNFLSTEGKDGGKPMVLITDQ